ncbi:aldo/keto reductase [Sphingopyxis granuli]|uniref:aldo/keto reductase n=1 Tax=Sphingopyxis granuli TaxID=267128 RepID=UPI001BAF6715|nr:aldo/keto reductase [Sphingopyxis granuli]QUM71311.1 aldo/keto reductase [Sphingopyxis granuli]
MELALGTVQFGLAYGVAGNDRPVADGEAGAILAAAHEAGIRRLDTAPAYGDIEERLAALCGTLDFSIVSKIPAMPAGLDRASAATWLRQSVERSRQRLGDRLCGLIFHDALLPLGRLGDTLRDALEDALTGTGIRTGSSHYSAETLPDPSQWPGHDMAQLAGNAYDQRIAALAERLSGTEVSLRSAFLQGLLLIDRDRAAARVPEAAEWLTQWDEWCEAAGVSRLAGALAVAKSFTAVDYCLVGVDSLAQLKDIVAAWSNTPAMAAPELAGHDARVFDPRQWRS